MRDADTTRELARTRGDQWSVAVAQLEIGSLLGQTGDFTGVVTYYREAVQILAEVGADQDSRQALGYVVAALIGAGRLDEAHGAYPDFARGWQHSDPDPSELPEVTSGILLGAAELAHADGDKDSGLADIPQLGSVSLALGGVYCACLPGSVDGGRLMLVSRRLGGRLDYPALRDLDRSALELSGTAAGDWDRISAEIVTLSRRQAADVLVGIVKKGLPEADVGVQALRMYDFTVSGAMIAMMIAAPTSDQSTWMPT